MCVSACYNFWPAVIVIWDGDIPQFPDDSAFYLTRSYIQLDGEPIVGLPRSMSMDGVLPTNPGQGRRCKDEVKDHLTMFGVREPACRGSQWVIDHNESHALEHTRLL